MPPWTRGHEPRVWLDRGIKSEVHVRGQWDKEEMEIEEKNGNRRVDFCPATPNMRKWLAKLAEWLEFYQTCYRGINRTSLMTYMEICVSMMVRNLQFW